VLVAVGLDGSVSLGKAEGVTDAMDFLRRAKAGAIASLPDRVAVLGGGNTAMDAAVTARGLGARDVYLLYRRSFAEMPAWPAERDRFVAAGCHALILTRPVGYETDRRGRITGVRIVRTELGEPDASGRRRPADVAGTESVLRVGLAIEAIGQEASEALRRALPGVDFTPDGLVATAGDSLATSAEGVWAAGDVLSGGATAVQSVAEGMRAADEMDRALGSR
jgi:NADPH-dependent glutamate synthase beta subunit-like oxidoreductase